MNRFDPYTLKTAFNIWLVERDQLHFIFTQRITFGSKNSLKAKKGQKGQKKANKGCWRPTKAKIIENVIFLQWIDLTRFCIGTGWAGWDLPTQILLDQRHRKPSVFLFTIWPSVFMFRRTCLDLKNKGKKCQSRPIKGRTFLFLHGIPDLE